MIYLDNAAITEPKTEVVEIVVNTLKNNWYNASSVNYQKGAESKNIIEHTRNLIAQTINCNVDEVIFVGSGSEGNTLAIDGWLKANNRNHFVTGQLEHASITQNPNAKILIKCDKLGHYNYSDVTKIKNELVSLQLANNEIGTIQDIKSIAKTLHRNNCILHVDATQAFGHIPINVKELEVDMLSSASQKISGVCGSGFLYVKNGIRIEPIIYGTQENNLRGSTYNVPAIAAFGKAIELIDFKLNDKIYQMQTYLLTTLEKHFDIEINGDMCNRLPNNINFRFKKSNLNSQQIVTILDELGYQTSTGSACHAGTNTPSYVLKALGLSDNEANNSIRITISDKTTYKEIESFVKDLKYIKDNYL